MAFETTLARFDEMKIDAIFAALDQCQRPGAAVGIAIGGDPVYRKGFGLANMELPALLSPTIRMRIGSTTKHFTCLAYLLLCEDGKADLDDPIEKHLAEINPVAHGVTMRQLMGHTSGLRDMLSVNLLINGMCAPVTEAQTIEQYAAIDDSDFAPGTAWSYNNGGYQLLTVAIERIAGEPLDHILRRRVFIPLGMNDTLLRRWERGFVANSATLHTIDAAGTYGREYMGMEISGPGGLVSTMDDMLMWMKHMDAPKVGSAETWRLLKQPQTLANGQSTGYGLGLITLPYRGIETLSHAGAVMGGNSQMIKVPSAGLDITVAVNRGDANAPLLASQIIDALVDGLEPVPEPSGREPVCGLYLSPASGRVVELSGKDKVQLFSLDGSAGAPVQPDHDGVLQLPEIARYLQTTFAPDDGGGRLVEFGNEVVFELIDADRESKLCAHAGHYRSATLAAMAEVADGPNGARFTVTGPCGRIVFALTPMTADIWRISGLGGLASVAGTVTFDTGGFNVTFTRLKRVRFARA